jgi:drug/metabolite transporter (DMT)-like permease
MKSRDIIDLIVLAALWGASFLFMRISVPEFGAVPMMAIRVAMAALVLIPVLILKRRQQVIIDNFKPLILVGLFNSALPFSLIAYSTIYVTAGFASVLNAATPIFASVIAFVWFGQRLSKLAALGLMIGLFGVILLVWDKIGFSGNNLTLAIVAGVSGTLSYGIAANYSKSKLGLMDPLSITAGSLITASILLAPLAIYWWPETRPSSAAWINVSILAVACTAFAQLLFFRLIDRTGATNATVVTFLIPVFGLLWGYFFLDETAPVSTLVAGFVILAGTGLSTGLIQKKKSL